MALENENIIKIAVGKQFSVFLGDDGNVWICGKWDIYRKDYMQRVPLKVEFFEENGIKITDVQCGENHIVALDMNGKLYSWGGYAELLGHGEDYTEGEIPKLIERLKDYVVDLIRCGVRHTYARTTCGQHFMFGRNRFGECMIVEIGKYLGKPMTVHEYIKENCNILRIIDIFPGHYNTKIICESEVMLFR